MKILDLISAQCGVQGVDKKYAERIVKISGITEEKDGNISAAVKNFKENILPAIEEAERGSEEAGKKAIEDYEKKYNLKDGKAIEQQEPEKKEEVKTENSEIAELKKMLQDVLAKQKNNETLESVRAKLKNKIDAEFIDDYIGRVKLDAEDIDAEIERVAKSYADMQQRFLNKAVQDGNYQPVNGGISVKDDKDIDAYIEQKTKDSQEGEFAGIKI